MSEETDHVLRAVRSLFEAWCDRRWVNALRALLSGHPLTSPLADGWNELLISLQNVRAFARAELTESESATLDTCIRDVDRIVHRR